MSNVTLKALAEQQAEICRVFANPTRVMILWALAKHERSVTEIAEAVDASLQSTSQHLRIMKKKKVLTSRRDGQTIYYRVSDVATAGCQLVLEAAPKRAIPQRAALERAGSSES